MKQNCGFNEETKKLKLSGIEFNVPIVYLAYNGQKRRCMGSIIDPAPSNVDRSSICMNVLSGDTARVPTNSAVGGVN